MSSFDRQTDSVYFSHVVVLVKNVVSHLDHSLHLMCFIVLSSFGCIGYNQIIKLVYS